VTEINVRHSKRCDADLLRTIYTGKQAVAGTLQLPHVPESVWEDRLAKPLPGVHSLVAELADTVSGHIVLHVNQNPRRGHTGVIGMAVLEGFERKGVGSALLSSALDLADNWLNLSRVELTVYTDNTAAINMYKKFAFLVEGEAEKFAFRDGEFVNALYMARVKSVATQ